jgi:hypothetical protein
MPLPQYVAGLGFFLGTTAGVAVAAWLILRRRLGHLAGSPRVLAGALLFTLGTLAAHVVPLALGALTRGTVLGAAALLALGATLVPATAAARGGRPVSVDGPASIALAALAVLGVVAFELARLRALAFQQPTDIDVLNFHLPGVARWIQSGSLWRIDQLFPYFVTGYYPNNGDAIVLGAVLPWRLAAFARLVEVPYLALTGLAVYALARELRAPRSTAAAFAAAVSVVPALSDYALDGLPDVIMLFAFGTGALFAVRYERGGRRSELMLAGAALGLAFGAKWYGVTSVAALLVSWGVLALVARRGLWRVLRDGAIVIGAIGAAGGVWLLRNVVESGNPLYPQRFSVLGLQLFPAPRHAILDRVGYTILDYLFKPSVLDHYVLPGWRTRLGVTGAVLALGLVAALVSVAPRLRRAGRAPSRDMMVAALGLATAGIAFLYALTPGSAFGLRDRPVQAFTNVRWLVPALLLAAALSAAWAGASPRRRLLAELVAVGAVIDGIHRGPPVSAASLVAGLAVAVLAGAAGWLAWRRPGPLSGAGRPVGAAAAVALLLALAAAGRWDQQRFAGHTCGAAEPPIAWIGRHAPSAHRVGLAGVWSVNGPSPVLCSFGPRLRNRVAYVGPMPAGLLRQYNREPNFQRAVRRGRYDLVLVGRGQPPLPRAREEPWLSRIGFAPVSTSARLALYRAPPSAGP